MLPGTVRVHSPGSLKAVGGHQQNRLTSWDSGWTMRVGREEVGGGAVGSGSFCGTPDFLTASALPPPLEGK